MAKWEVGDVRVTRVLEQQAPVPPEELIANIDPERLRGHMSWLAPHFIDAEGQIILSIHALVVESCGKTIVVDTCMGNDRPLPMDFPALHTSFLEDLEKVVAREEVDYVLCTHLHFDHVGWNTMLQDGEGVPTCPNARYLFGREEYEHWTSAEASDVVDLGYAVTPIVEAGLHELVETDHRITDEVRLESTPGHTPGHVSVRIDSGGSAAVITGDMVHHPVQLAEPTWSSHPDSIPEMAIQTRRDFVKRYGDQPVLVIGTHFAGPTAGHIVLDGDSCRLKV
ncbi:MAG: MBL fold metallo-hydrolase [Deltaproteobacteria bacterium]|nr:MBL fold metallo-hydrolase [Deltaproteobacteria bacterium]